MDKRNDEKTNNERMIQVICNTLFLFFSPEFKLGERKENLKTPYKTLKISCRLKGRARHSNLTQTQLRNMSCIYKHHPQMGGVFLLGEYNMTIFWIDTFHVSIGL